MNPVQELIENQERSYVRSDELAGKMPTPPVRPPSTAAADDPLHSIEAGLYPVCQRCGERIEIDRLQENAQATDCGRCAARPRDYTHGRG